MKPKFVVWETDPGTVKAHAFRALGKDYVRRGVEWLSLCGLTKRPPMEALSLDTKGLRCRNCQKMVGMVRWK